MWNETLCPRQLLALGVIAIVAFPVMGVNEGIDNNEVLSARPIAAPPETSKTTPAGDPVRGSEEV
jgi:hypothetical protein